MGMTVTDCGTAGVSILAPGIERIDGFFPSSFLAIQTTRDGGVSSGPYASLNLATHVGDDPSCVAANRAKLQQHLAARPLWLHQVHGTSIADCSSGHEPDADAGIVKDRDHAAVVMTADCLPLLVARPSTGQCAAIHAGWKGLAAGVVQATLDRMALVDGDLKGGHQDDWFVWLGPVIGPKAFEVGRDVVDAFTRDDPGAMAAFTGLDAKETSGMSAVAPHKWLADLSLLTARKLECWAATFPGTARLFVARSNECVYSDQARYFSFRRDKVCGRMASLICCLE